MINTEGHALMSRWAVMWVYKKRGKTTLFRKNFGDDYASAHDLYLKAHDAGKAFATLACINMAFPPPENLRSRTVKKRGRSKRTGKIKIVTIEENPLRELNLGGELWCPYCRSVRKFNLKRGFAVDGVTVRVDTAGYHCPICGISNRDHHVRFWNPTATMHMESSLSSLRGTRKSTTTRRRRRR